MGGLAGLALLACLLTAGCNGSEPVDPGPLPGGDGGNGGTSGGGGGDSTSIGDVSLVGNWQNITTPTDGGDVSRVTTTWVFNEDGTCGRAIVTESASAGISSVLRVGLCHASGTEIDVLFTAESVTFTMIYGFPNSSTLTLDGVFYDPVASP